MASHHRRPRRLLLPIVLAAILAAEITGLALARSMTATPGGSARPPVAADAAEFTADARLDGPLLVRGDGRAARTDGARDVVTTTARRTPPSPANLRGPAPAIAATVHGTTSSTTKTTSPSAAPRARTAEFRGSNHVWIPSLGISRSVQFFPCSRTRAPDAGVYRWGCSGRNNVYLMSHAWSTFKPLHDAYVGGRLRKGMSVWYADGAGRVHEYRVTWWRVVAPTTAASWAWAPQSRPSMTLQTCVGSRSQYRLMVRMLQVG